jgi:hypothetical protein
MSNRRMVAVGCAVVLAAAATGLQLEAQKKPGGTKTTSVGVTFRCNMDAPLEDCQDEDVQGDTATTAYSGTIDGGRLVVLLPSDGSRRWSGSFSDCAVDCDLYVPQLLVTRWGRLVVYAVDAEGKEYPGGLTAIEVGSTLQALILIDFTIDQTRKNNEKYTVRFQPPNYPASTWGFVRRLSKTQWEIEASAGSKGAVEYTSATQSLQYRGTFSLEFQAAVTQQ